MLVVLECIKKCAKADNKKVLKNSLLSSIPRMNKFYSIQTTRGHKI